MEKYFAFRRAGDMVDHRFTDSVAVCKAVSLSQAKRKFSQMYDHVGDAEIIQITDNFNAYGISILTDY